MPGECNCHDSYAGSNCEIGTVTTLQTTLQTTVTTLQTTFILYSAKFCAKMCTVITAIALHHGPVSICYKQGKASQERSRQEYKERAARVRLIEANSRVKMIEPY